MFPPCAQGHPLRPAGQCEAELHGCGPEIRVLQERVSGLMPNGIISESFVKRLWVETYFLTVFI